MIAKNKAAYLVTVNGMEVIVSVHQTDSRFTATKTIADTLQILGNTRLVLAHPANPLEFLKQYYQSKGWTIESE